MEIKRNEFSGRTATPRTKHSAERLVPGEPGVVRVNDNKTQNSTELCKRMFGEFDIPLDSYSKDNDNGEHTRTVYDYVKIKSMPGYEAQHIIPIEMAEHPIIQKIGMDMNHPQNGIPLPVPDGNPHALSTHRGYHKIYNDAVKEQLDDIAERLGENASIGALEREVYDLQCRLRKALENGTPLYKKKEGTDGYKDPTKKKPVEQRGGGATDELWRKVLALD